VSDHRRRFEELYTAHHDSVLGYLLRRTDSHDDAADVLAETFLTTWRRVADVPPGDQARPWLYGVARRTLANHRRGENRRSALAGRLRDDLAAAGPPAELDGAAGAAFTALPESDRELLALMAWEQLDTAEIATVLGCSRNAVRIRLHRARRRFERLLDAPRQPALSATKEHFHD
jgi:RNA polymerase sigma factor (sigma-70 family)